MAERIWPEINSRVHCPIKSALMNMEESGIIIWMIHCISLVFPTVPLGWLSAGAETAIAAWNDHPIPSELKWNVQLLMKCTYVNASS